MSLQSDRGHTLTIIIFVLNYQIYEHMFFVAKLVPNLEQVLSFVIWRVKVVWPRPLCNYWKRSKTKTFGMVRSSYVSFESMLPIQIYSKCKDVGYNRASRTNLNNFFLENQRISQQENRWKRRMLPK